MNTMRNEIWCSPTRANCGARKFLQRAIPDQQASVGKIRLEIIFDISALKWR